MCVFCVKRSRPLPREVLQCQIAHWIGRRDLGARGKPGGGPEPQQILMKVMSITSSRVVLRTLNVRFVMYHGFGVEMQISTNHGAFTDTPPKCVARGVLDLAT